MAKKYNLQTYGCQMNEYDSNMIAQMLEDRDCQATKDPADADFVIVNTCSVRGKAEDTAYARISQLKPMKAENPNMKIAVIGCMARNKGGNIPADLKHVDYVLGPDNYQGIEDLLFEEKTGTSVKNKIAKHVKVITEFDSVENYVGQKAKLNSSYSSFITIQRGCNKRCTYCIVPFVRGNEKYRPYQDVLDEINMAVDKGVSEITLLGQTVNSYNTDGHTFASLLQGVAEINGLKRIRFTSPHPKHYSNDLIWVIKHNENISRQAHIPVQSGSSRILKEMRRQYDREKFLDIVEKLRGISPDYALSTDVIVGFVGEERKDFEDTLSLMREVRFDSAFMFAYSPREGTRAFDQQETLTKEMKQAWLQELIETQNKITFEINKTMMGKTKEILIEGPSHRNPDEWVGKTDCFKKVIIPNNNYSPGDYVNVYIDDMRGWTLRGKPIDILFKG